jgi:hypothetical protein
VTLLRVLSQRTAVGFDLVENVLHK